MQITKTSKAVTRPAKVDPDHIEEPESSTTPYVNPTVTNPPFEPIPVKED